MSSSTSKPLTLDEAERRLRARSVEEWSAQYVSLSRLRAVVQSLSPLPASLPPASPPSDAGDDGGPALLVSASPSARGCAEFWDVVEEDLARLDDFADRKARELAARFDLCNPQARDRAEAAGEVPLDEVAGGGRKKKRKNKGGAPPHDGYAKLSAHTGAEREARLEEAREEVLEVWEGAARLGDFVELNAELLRAAVAALDEATGQSNLPSFEERVARRAFAAGDALGDLRRDVSNAYTALYGEHPQAALEARGGGAARGDAAGAGARRGRAAKPRVIAAALAVMGLVLVLPLFPHRPRARRGLAMLLAVMVCWVFEALPFFVTALAIPLLTVLLRVLADEDGRELGAKDAAHAVLGHMFGDTAMLVLGGFSISAAFSKYHFELMLARHLQRRLGHRPRLFLLAFMLLGWFLSAWISNVAAPVLLTTVLLPVMHDFPRRSRYARALLLGLAIACNIGGMLSVISSPQNAISVGLLNAVPGVSVSFLDWVLVSVPYTLACVLSAWAYVCVALRPDDVPRIPEIVYRGEPLRREHHAVLAVSFLTVALWCSLSFSEPAFGSMGVLAAVPLVAFFGSGILTKEDLKGFSWNLILLIGGGGVLGEAVRSSELLHMLADAVKGFLQGQSLWVATLIVCLIVLLVTTGVSHTVASLVLIPVVIEIGQAIGRVEVVAVAAALMCSGSMSLPMTSFPNMSALLTLDQFGRPYLRVADFARHGTPNSVICLVWLMTLGFVLLTAVF